MKNNKITNETKVLDTFLENINRMKKSKTISIYISIVSGIFGVIFSLIAAWQMNLSISKTQEINKTVHNSEDSENYSKIISDYSQAVNKHIKISYQIFP